MKKLFSSLVVIGLLSANIYAEDVIKIENASISKERAIQNLKKDLLSNQLIKQTNACLSRINTFITNAVLAGNFSTQVYLPVGACETKNFNYTKPNNIYVIFDNKELVNFLIVTLEEQGYRVTFDKDNYLNIGF